MKHLLLHRLFALALISGSFLSAASFAHAEILIIPVMYQYDGLTFSEPLTYDNPLPVLPATLTFSTVAEQQLTEEAQPSTKPFLILSPTIGQAHGTKIFQAVLPTPTLYIQPTHVIYTKTPVPTATPQPTEAPMSAPTTPPQPVVAAVSNGGMADTLFTMSNNYRQERGLPPFQKDERTCSLAASRAPEVAGEVASGALHSGLQARNLSYWNTENIISMNSAEAAFNWWINDPIHHDAIVGNYTYSCVACSGGNCAQEFTNYQPK